MNTSPIRIELTSEEQTELQKRARGQRVAHRDAVRAQIILLLADGHTLSDTARRARRERKVVRKWAHRFMKKRLDGLRDKAGRGIGPASPPGGRHAFGQTRL